MMPWIYCFDRVIPLIIDTVPVQTSMEVVVVVVMEVEQGRRRAGQAIPMGLLGLLNMGTMKAEKIPRSPAEKGKEGA